METKEKIMTDKELELYGKQYIAWLELQYVNALQTIDRMEQELGAIARRNIQLEEESFATTVALLRNPLRSSREYRA